MVLDLKIIRLMYVFLILLRYQVYKLISLSLFTYPLYLLSYLFPRNWRSKKNRTRGADLRISLEKLGPIFVKFGQLLSTRRDALPEDIIEELEKLQDCVAPFSEKKALLIIQEIYGKDCLETLFLEFTKKPLASASIAQVHAAVLRDGSEVVVKLLRPNIHTIIKRDVALLYTLINIIGLFWKDIYCLKPKALIEEFARSLEDELNLMHEAASASQLQRNFAHSLLLSTPKIYWQYAHKNSIIMERIYGIPIANITELKAAGINLKKLAERAIEMFLIQAFRDSFFHADMHPGNIFVSRENPKTPSFILVDFGIMGSLNSADQRYLAANILAFLNRDYRRVAALHIESSWVPANTRIDQFEASIRAVCEPMFAKPLKDISFGQLLLHLFQTAKRFNIQIQPQLLLMQKTLLNIESLGRMLYPEVDLWSTAKPFLEQWMKKQMGYKNFFKKMLANMPLWIEKMPDLPDLIYEALSQYRKI